ncbi:MAG TPA: DinB family protein [Vicinamibacterales bacterium]|nr:DinB family protein [Vicinamibacterales bacterium]
MTHTIPTPDTRTGAAGPQADALAERLEQGAQALITFAGSLTDAEWRSTPLKDRRPVGVIVHHVASIYPLEIQLAQAIAAGQPITGVTWDAVADVNAKHAADNPTPTKEEAIALLRQNSAAAAAAIRALTGEQLATATPNSLYEDAPLTCQFFIEDHALRHSYHHMVLIRRALGR